tara:strand:+ start:395 stop:2257 length:1863 start_codon:yes stop_codon:yes gene_type:complete
MAEALKPINGGGLQLTPFNTHKRWVVTDDNYRQDYYSVSILKGISPGFNERINVSESINRDLIRQSDELDNSNSNSTNYLSLKHQKNIWSGVNQMFFKHRVNNERDLYTSASIFSVPHNRMGDGIKPGSISVTDYSVSSSTIDQLNIIDRKIDENHGYLIDTDLNTGSYIQFSDLVGYWGFNDEVIPRTAGIDSNIQDRSGYAHHATGKNLIYSNGITTTGDYESPTGTKVTFNGVDSYIKVNHNKQLDFFKDTNYAISMWTLLPTSQSDTSSDFNWIMSKSGTMRDYGQNKKLQSVLRYSNIATPIFPFDLKVYNQNTSNNGKLVASLSDGNTAVEVTSDTVLNDVSEHHIVFNKTGSLLELWVDGVKEVSSSIQLKSQISNEYDMLLGSKFTSETNTELKEGFKTLSGSLDEVRVYRRGLTPDEISGLSNNDYTTGSAYQTNIVGEVFYKHGIMVVSDPRPIYNEVWTGASGSWDYGNDYGFQTKYKSTKELHEIALLCEIGSNEFNVSQNPSLKKNNDINSEFLQPFVTGSNFSPYFTTIGLYNPNGDLIAVSKLASAIKNRDDVDITIKVRLDLDGPFGTPSTGSLEPKGRNATLYKRADGRFVWNKLDKPDIGVF